MLSSSSQEKKAYSQIWVTLLPIVILFKLIHSEKVDLSIVLKLLPVLKLLILSQPENADSPINDILSGISILVKLLHFANA